MVSVDGCVRTESLRRRTPSRPSANRSLLVSLSDFTGLFRSLTTFSEKPASIVTANTQAAQVIKMHLNIAFGEISDPAAHRLINVETQNTQRINGSVIIRQHLPHYQ
jgi:hypothetical protein